MGVGWSWASLGEPSRERRWKMHAGQSDSDWPSARAAPHSAHFRSALMNSVRTEAFCPWLEKHSQAVVSSTQRFQEMRNLPVDILGIIDGVGDFLAKQRHVTLADALDAGAHAALGYLPSCGETGVFTRRRLLEEQSAQGVEPVGLAGLLEFGAQPFHDRLENRLGPSTIECQFGRGFRGRLMAVAC